MNEWNENKSFLPCPEMVCLLLFPSAIPAFQDIGRESNHGHKGLQFSIKNQKSKNKKKLNAKPTPNSSLPDEPKES